MEEICPFCESTATTKEYCEDGVETWMCHSCKNEFEVEAGDDHDKPSIKSDNPNFRRY